MISTIRQAISLGWCEADGFVKKRLMAVVGLVIFTAVFSAFAPIALKFAVDILGGEEFKFFDQQIFQDWGMSPDSSITIGPALFILIYIFSLWLSRSSGELRWYFYGTADQRLHRNISRRLFDHVMKLPLKFHLDHQTGALNQTLAQGIAGYSILLNHMVFTILPVLIEIALISAMLAIFLSSGFIIILLLSVIGYAVVFAVGVTQIAYPSREVSSTQIEAYAALTDSIINSETVKYFTAENHINEHYDNRLATAESGWARFYACKTQNGLLIACVFALSLGSAITLAASQVMQGIITIGDFILINAYMLQIIRPMEQLGDAFKSIVHGTAFIEKMLEVLDKKTENFTDIQTSNSILSADDKDFPAGQGGELVFDHVIFSYLPDRLGSRDKFNAVLKNVSFTVKPGKTTAIVGSSGAGKSSIIRLLLRFFEPDQGNILLNGLSIQDIALSDLRRHIAVVPQDTVLFNNSIAYNIGFGKQGSTNAEIEQAAKKAHIHDKIMTMPEGYQTMVGERGLKLSGGEKQRISIARASLKNPQIFVFDEATSSLDSKTERQILDNLTHVAKSATTLMIAHRLSTVVHADEILVLDQGEIIERGNHGHLLQINGRYAAMWRTQQRDRKVIKLHN